MAIQKQERKITYKGRGLEDEDEEKSSALRISIQKREKRRKAGSRILEEEDGGRQETDEEAQEIRGDGKERAKSGQTSGHKEKDDEIDDGRGWEKKNIDREKTISNIAKSQNRERITSENIEQISSETSVESSTESVFLGEKMPEMEETGERIKAAGDVTAENYRNFSSCQGMSDERISYTDGAAGERVVRMDEVRRFQNHGTSTGKNEDSNADTNADSNQNYSRWKENWDRGRDIRTKTQGNERKENRESATYERFRESERESLSRMHDSGQNPVSGRKAQDGDSTELTESSGRAFHQQRGKFSQTENQIQNCDGFARPQNMGEQKIRSFSQSVREMEDMEGRASQQARNARREMRKAGKDASESAKKVQHAVRKTGEEVGKTVSEAADSITMYSEVVTRPLDTGKRTFAAGRETFSKEFRSVKELTSSVKDADEVVSSKAKEMLKAMAVRTFREAAMLPVKLAKAMIKTVAFVVTTVATGGLNLLILLIALILAAAVLTSIIIFAGGMLIAYGISEGWLSF